MANPEHLKILKQGVEVWNQWREEHPDEEIDLSEVDLIGTDLSGADLSVANLSRADLIKADLTGANLSGADSTGSNFHKATLREVDFSEAILIGTHLWEADLSGADLSRTNLFEVEFIGANLREANLERVNLRGATLMQANFSGANITGAFLYGTARDNWIIDGIQCEYIYWDFSGKERTPKERDFRPGEFEKLYKHLPTFEYYFEHGFTPLDAVVMDRVVQAINERHPEFEVKLGSFHSRGQPHAVFTVLHKDNAEEARRQITAEYETKLKVLEGQLDALREVLLKAIERPQIVERIINVGRDYFEHVEGDVTTGASSHDDQKEWETEGETGGSEPLTCEGQSTQ